MSAFIPTLRGAFLMLSRQSWLRRWMEQSPAARPLTTRFIAGLALDDAIRVSTDLDRAGMMTSLDYLGENVTALDEARASRDAYLTALDRIHATALPSTISMKITALGLDISEDACLENTDALARKAREIGSRVEMDMEASEYVERNLHILRTMHERHGTVRAVIQAYLYRSEKDIEDLNARGIPVRLCKGAYQEPPEIAWPKKQDVDESYLRLMRTLLDRGTYPALATHDDHMITAALEHIQRNGYKPDRFEFQMLYGVRRDLQRMLVEKGYRVRLYVPYGAAWYPYFMRRLAERPANAWFIVKNITKG